MHTMYAMQKTNITSTNYWKANKMAASMEHEKKENKVIKSVPKQSNEKRLIVVLERASLESVKVCNVYRIRFSCQLKQRTIKVELSLCLMFLF